MRLEKTDHLPQMVSLAKPRATCCCCYLFPKPPSCLAWQNSGASLEKKYDAVRNATRQKLDEELAKTKMKQGQDPDDFLYIKETVGDCLLDMGEHISPSAMATH